MPANFVKLPMPEKEDVQLKFPATRSIFIKQKPEQFLSQQFYADEVWKSYGTISNHYYFFLDGRKTARFQVPKNTVMEVWDAGFLTTYI